MSAAVLAMKQFNDRDASVVPQLEDALVRDCPVRFDLNGSQFFDTQTTTHVASRVLFQQLISDSQEEQQMNRRLCAIVGPNNDIPAQDLSTLAQAAEIPLVVHRSFNNRVVSPRYSPFTSQVYPDYSVQAERMVEFLQSKGRNNFTTILYPLSGAYY